MNNIQKVMESETATKQDLLRAVVAEIESRKANENTGESSHDAITRIENKPLTDLATHLTNLIDSDV